MDIIYNFLDDVHFLIDTRTTSEANVPASLKSEQVV